MRFKGAMIFVLTAFADAAPAAERYTEAQITQVETSDNAVILFLQVVSGDSPPTGNGGSNEPLTKSYLWLAVTPEDIAARKHLLGSAFVALTNGAQVRFRWEDTTNRIVTMLVRSN